MFYIELAELTIKIENKYPQLEKLCCDYIVQPREYDFCVSVDDEQIDTELAKSENKFSRAYAESICVYRDICMRLPMYDAFVFHASVVEYAGRAYAFAAQSGTGKSTHSMLWLNYFNGARIINGDKPILRIKNDIVYVYGTPWCGKEGFNINARAPLFSICFLERNINNSIEKITPDEALGRLFNQILIPGDRIAAEKFLYLIDLLLAKVSCYLLQCNMSEEAAYIAYKGMNNIKEEGFYEEEK